MLTHIHTHTQSTCWHLAHPLIFLHSLSHRKCMLKYSASALHAAPPINVCRWKVKLCAIIWVCGFNSPQMLIGANIHAAINIAMRHRWEGNGSKEDFLIYLYGHLPAYINFCEWKGEFYIFNKPDAALDACVCAPIIVISNWPGSIGVARLQLNQNCSKRNWILFPIGRPLK
jgi:hypothetical protein